MNKIFVFFLTSGLFWVIALPFLWKKGEESSVASLALVSHSYDQLKGEAVAEWLDLSVDQPIPLNRFDLREGEDKLLKIGLIKKVQLYTLKPSVLVVSYTLRQPFATIANYKNLGIDAEGVPFPLSPFFTPKELPEIVFKEIPELHFSPLKEIAFPQFPLAKKILEMDPLFSPWTLFRVDLSRLTEDHPFGGELVLMLKQGEKKMFIRLWADRFEQSLTECAPLVFKLEEGQGVDLRLSSRILVF